MRSWQVLSIIGLLLSSASSVTAQQDPEDTVFIFNFELDETAATIGPQDSYYFTGIFHDDSRDSTGPLGGPPVSPNSHRVSWSKVIYTDESGWTVNLPGPVRTIGGESKEFQFQVSSSQQVREPVLQFGMIAKVKAPGYEKVFVLNYTVITTGPATFLAKPPGTLLLKPGEIASADLRITNHGLLPREFAIEVSSNPCGMNVGLPGTIVGIPKQEVEAPVTVEAPMDKFWYSSVFCDVYFDVYALDQPGNVNSVKVSSQIQGTYIDPEWIFNAMAVVVAAIIIFLLVARRKARIEEEILGRPQKPWLIPVEKVYLEHLKERDPQAHYVVRHFLMEEEYASSLLWYRDYKKATKGSRSKERVVVAQEHKYERFKNRWTRKIAAPGKKADKFEARLQKKLDRQGKAGARKERRKWKKLVKTMKAAHKKKVAKATEKWEKQVAKWEKQAAKAEKKGTAVPDKPAEPQIPEPDYPDEPTGDRILLANHKWNKKAKKAHAKAAKKTGNLEVKFEKKDAKMLRKVRRKVTKIARKLDDPEFIDEHPLLAQPAD